MPVAVLVALLVVLVAPLAGMPTGADARAAATDLTLVTDATYTVYPDEGRVGVAMAITARNHTAESRTRKFWFDHAFLAVQPGATRPHISGPKGSRVRVVRATKDATLLRIDFGSRLYSGKTASFRVGFDLPGRGRKAAPQVRVGSTLVTVPVWAYASDGAKGSHVAVRFPAGWDVAVESGAFARRETTADGGTLLASGALAEPLRYFAFVSAQQPAVYEDRSLVVDTGDGEADLRLEAWQDDPGWATRIGSLLTRALPVLREEIGLPWPVAEPLVVREAVSRDADASAGVYDPGQNLVEVAYWADHDAVIHQAAHAWFNGSLLGDRWANEGFATYYAQRAAAALEVPSAPPAMTKEAQAASFPLDAWPAGESTGAATPGDRYGYAASLALATAIAEQAGDDALAATWADAAAGIGAYQPPGTGTSAERVEGAPDWRGLLDLLEDHAGTSLAALWRESVVRPGEAPLLDARAEARAAYARTMAIAGDWQLPRAIRDALRAWDFETAQARMAEARTVLAQHKALASLAGRDGIALPDTMRVLFEAGSLAEASARAEAEREAILAIEDAVASRSSDDDVLSRLGMLGEDPDGAIAEARAALAAGDLDGSRAAADRAERAWTQAWSEGRRRALLAVAAIATLVVLGSAAAGHLRRRRRATTDGAAAGDGAAPA